MKSFARDGDNDGGNTLATVRPPGVCAGVRSRCRAHDPVRTIRYARSGSSHTDRVRSLLSSRAAQTTPAPTRSA